MLKIKKNRNIIVYFWYLVLFFLSVYDLANRNIYYALIIVINTIIVLKDRESVAAPVLSSFLIGNEVFCAANLLITLFFAKQEQNKNYDKKTIIGFLLVIFLSLANAILNQTYVNVIISLVYIFVIYYVLIKSNDILKEDYFNVIKWFSIIEFIITIYIVFVNKTFYPSDINYGTLNNAHAFGNWCIVSLMVLHHRHKGYLEFLQKDFFFIILLVAMLVLSDAKTLLICLIITMLMTTVFKRPLFGKNGVKLFFIALYVGLYVLCAIVYNPTAKSFIVSHFPKYSNYIYSPSYNYKFYYISNTLQKELSGFRIMTGYGLGQYGSRFANLFAYDSMVRNDSTINNLIEANFKPHHIENYVKYIRFYSNSFVKTIHFKSAILTYPFSSLIAIIGETGLIGIWLLYIVINRFVYNSKLKNLLYYFFIICLFDTFFDMILIIGYVVVLLANSKKMSESEG